MKITPETYEKMNEYFAEHEPHFRVSVPTQEAIDTWHAQPEYYPAAAVESNGQIPCEKTLIDKLNEEDAAMTEKDTKELELNVYINAICDILKATHHYTTVLDSYGKESKRLTFTYDPKSL